MNAPILDLRASLSPPLRLAHRDGGFLEFSTTKFIATLEAKVIKQGADYSDVLELAKTVIDDRGQGHRFVTHISAYDLWDRITSSVAYLEQAFRSSWRFSKESALIPVAEDLKVFSDMRDSRAFCLFTAHDQHPLLFRAREKYFTATVTLLLHRRPIRDEFLARIIVYQQFADSTETMEIGADHRLIVPIPTQLVLWNNYWRQSVVDEEMGITWNRACIAQPIIAHAVDVTGEPQDGVAWNRIG